MSRRTKPKDIRELNCKRMRVQLRLMERYWQLDREHVELWQYIETAKVTLKFCHSAKARKALADNIEHLADTDARVCRQRDKYALWSSRIIYWIILFDAAHDRWMESKPQRQNTSVEPINFE